MAYHDQFRDPAYYYATIHRLIDTYRERGYVIAVADWEKELTKLTDFPSLKRLADKANFMHKLLLERL